MTLNPEDFSKLMFLQSEGKAICQFLNKEVEELKDPWAKKYAKGVINDFQSIVHDMSQLTIKIAQKHQSRKGYFIRYAVEYGEFSRLESHIKMLNLWTDYCEFLRLILLNSNTSSLESEQIRNINTQGEP